jgi:hypothetical protein
MRRPPRTRWPPCCPTRPAGDRLPSGTAENIDVTAPVLAADLTVEHPTVDPALTAWHLAGSPSTGQASRGPGRCDRCGGRTAHTVHISDVVSDQFTGWDRYATAPGQPCWCAGCAWAHSDATLRTRPHIISTSRAGVADPTLLRHTLSTPLPPDLAVIIPLSRKKHLLPAAQWGTVTTDDLALRWGRQEARLLALVEWLRARGFSEAALSEPAPRYEALVRLTAADQAHVLSAWPDLQPWRANRVLLRIALLSTRKAAAA